MIYFTALQVGIFEQLALLKALKCRDYYSTNDSIIGHTAK